MPPQHFALWQKRAWQIHRQQSKEAWVLPLLESVQQMSQRQPKEK
jgi:hypothetical protein